MKLFSKQARTQRKLDRLMKKMASANDYIEYLKLRGANNGR